MKVLLLTPPKIKDYRWNKVVFQPPIGLCYIAAVLEKKGYEPFIIDLLNENKSIEDLQKDIERINPDLIAISCCYSILQDSTENLIRFVKNKNKDIPILLGGAHTFLNYKGLMDKILVLDFLIRGEGEYSTVELLESLEGKKKLKDIKGLVYRSKGKIIINEPNEWIKNLDELPLPAFHLLKGFPNSYDLAFRYKRKPIGMVISSRGCPHDCVFCDRVFGKKYRAYSPEKLIELVKQLVNEYNIKEIFFGDDNFMVDHQRVRKFCELLKRERINISWSCQARIDTLYYHPDLLNIVKRAGCWYISLGLESGNKEVLKYIKKGIDFKQVKEVIKNCSKNNIFTKGYFIIGLPVDTEETVKDTINFAKSLHLNSVQFSLAVPYPGTEFYDLALKNNLIFNSTDCDKMSSHSTEPVYVPKGLTKEKMVELQKRGYREFYFRPIYLIKMLKYLLVNPYMFKNTIKHAITYYKKVYM